MIVVDFYAPWCVIQICDVVSTAINGRCYLAVRCLIHFVWQVSLVQTARPSVAADCGAATRPDICGGCANGQG